MIEVLLNNTIISSTSIPMSDVLINFLAAGVIAVFIYSTYRISYSGTIYNEQFSLSLIMIIFVTTLVMNVIIDNPTLVLGLIAAVSIVRFRTVIKDSRDIVYICWSVSGGLCCGISEYFLAGVGSVVIFGFLIIFGYIKNKERFLLSVKFESKAKELLEKSIASMFSGKAVLRVENRFMSNGMEKIIYEVSKDDLKKAESKNGTCEQVFFGIAGVRSVVLISQEHEIN